MRRKRKIGLTIASKAGGGGQGAGPNGARDTVDRAIARGAGTNEAGHMEDLDDVQNVYSNAEIPDQVLVSL